MVFENPFGADFKRVCHASDYGSDRSAGTIIREVFVGSRSLWVLLAVERFMTHNFRLIQGGKVGPDIMACHVCNGTTFLPAVAGIIAVNATPEGLDIDGGSDELICAQCLAEGKVEIL